MDQKLGITNNSQLLLQVLFNGKGESYNLPELDGKPCKTCQKIPPVRILQRTSKNGNLLIDKDRSGRIDCDAGNGVPLLETYHVTCWWVEIKRPASISF